MENAPTVVIREGRHKWKTHLERLGSLGLTEERYASLHANFNACIEIDKMRITREDPDKELFAGEVQRWLVGELTHEDRRTIYGRANLAYHPGFAVYNTMAYFKSRYMTKERGRLVQLAAGAAAAGEIAAAVAAAGEVAARVAAEAQVADAQAAIRIAAEAAAAARADAQDLNADHHASPAPPIYNLNDDFFLHSPSPNRRNLSPAPSLGSEIGRAEHNSPILGNALPIYDMDDLFLPSPSPNRRNQSPAPSLESEIGRVEDNSPILDIGFEHPFSPPDHDASPGGLEQDLENWSPFDGVPALDNADSHHPSPESPNQDPSPFQIEPGDVEMMVDNTPYRPENFRTGKRQRSPEESPSPLVLKRIRRDPTILSTLAQFDVLYRQMIGLASNESQGELLEHQAQLRRILGRRQNQAAEVAAVQKSRDAAMTSRHFINFHIRVRGDMAPVQAILDHGVPSFQHIWGPEAKNSDIALPFKEQMAAFPVFLVATGYSAGGKSYSLLMPNEQDPPVLEVLLNQALVNQALPLEVTVNTMLRSNTQQVVHRVHDPREIKQLLEALQTPGVTDNNGMNAQSSRQHVLIEVRTAVGKLVLSVIDLCGDETSKTRSGPLSVGSTAIATDLGALRVLVTQKLYGKFKAVEIIGNGRGCELTRRFVAQLPHFPKVNFIFFCDGSGSVQSVSNLFGEWTVGQVEQGRS